VLRAIMDISARALSLAVRPRTGHSGHQCSHAPASRAINDRNSLQADIPVPMASSFSSVTEEHEHARHCQFCPTATQADGALAMSGPVQLA
jgi:hypothetical protein